MSNELNIEDQIKEIDLEIAGYQEHIDRAKDWESLKTDERFMNVVTKGYLDLEATRLFKSLTSPKVKDMDEGKIMNQLVTIKGFNEYFGHDTGNYPGTIEFQANHAKQQILELDALKLKVLNGEEA